MLDWSCSGAYTAVPPPVRLAVYMATSARRASVSASTAWSGYTAMPMLPFTWRLIPPRWNGCSMADRIRAATASASIEVARCGQQHGELVTAETGDHVVLAEQFLEPVAQLDQQPVAVVVAERVVDLLELVEVHHQEGHGVEGVRRPAQRLSQPIGQVGAVGQPRQTVVQGLAAQHLGRGDLLGDVLERDAHRSAREREHVRRVDGTGQVLAFEAEVVVAEPLTGADHGGQRFVDELGGDLVRRGEQVREPPPDRTPGRDPEQLRALGVHGQHREAAVVVDVLEPEHEQRDVEVLDQVQVLVAALLGHLLSRDVDHHAAHADDVAAAVDLDAHAVVQPHHITVGTGEAVLDLAVLSRLDGLAVALGHPLAVVGMDVAVPEVRLGPVLGRVADDLLGSAVDVERRGVVGQLLPDDGVDAAHQIDVAGPHLALDAGDAADHRDDERGRECVDEERGPAVARVLDPQHAGDADASDDCAFGRHLASERDGRGGVDGQHDEQDRSDHLRGEGDEPHHDDLIAERDDRAEPIRPAHEPVVEVVVRHDHDDQGQRDPAAVGLGHGQQRGGGHGHDRHVAGAQRHPPDLQLTIA